MLFICFLLWPERSFSNKIEMTIIFSKIQFVFLFNDAQNFFVRIAQGLQAVDVYNGPLVKTTF